MKPLPEVAELGPPRTRVTLLRWMVLVAVIGACLAWVAPFLLPVVLLPVAVAAVVPNGRSWFAIETSAAFGWLLAAIASFSEIAPDVVEAAWLGLSGLVIAISWLCRFSRRFVSKHPGSWKDPRFLISPVLGGLGLALLPTDRDFQARFRMSEPALRAAATSILATPGDINDGPPGRVGLFWPTGVEEKGGCVLFWTKGGFLERFGMAYLPGGASPQTIPGFDGFFYEPLGGPWWRVHNN